MKKVINFFRWRLIFDVSLTTPPPTPTPTPPSPPPPPPIPLISTPTPEEGRWVHTNTYGPVYLKKGQLLIDVIDHLDGPPPPPIWF